jgi:hypothetical protein
MAERSYAEPGGLAPTGELMARYKRLFGEAVQTL